MKHHLRFALIGLATIAPLAGAATTPADAAATAPASIADAIAKGKFNLHARVRWEHADQANLRESEALTLRTRWCCNNGRIIRQIMMLIGIGC